MMKLEEIEEYYKDVIISFEEIKKRYNHEPFGKSKVTVTTEKAWENLGKLSSTQTIAEYRWNVLMNDLLEMAKDTEDHKEILAIDRRVRNFIKATRK